MTQVLPFYEFAGWCLDRTNWGASYRKAAQQALAMNAVAMRRAEGEEVEVAKSYGSTSAANARASVRKYAKNPANREKLRAKWRVQAKKRSGKLKPPKACSRCHRTGVKLQFHHDKGHNSDHGKWLCRFCHTHADHKLHGSAMSRSVKNGSKKK